MDERKDDLDSLPGDDEIDTSDIPEITDWSGARRGMFRQRFTKEEIQEAIDRAKKEGSMELRFRKHH